MHWNYRVVRRQEAGETVCGIHEAYYDGPGDAPNRITLEPVAVVGEDLVQVLGQMGEALTRPVLAYEAFVVTPGPTPPVDRPWDPFFAAPGIDMAGGTVPDHSAADRGSQAYHVGIRLRLDFERRRVIAISWDLPEFAAEGGEVFALLAALPEAIAAEFKTRHALAVQVLPLASPLDMTSSTVTAEFAALPLTALQLPDRDNEGPTSPEKFR